MSANSNPTHRPGWFRPVVTRSRLVLEMAYELIGNNEWPYQQAMVQLRPQGGDGWRAALFGSDSDEAIWSVARGEVQLAIINPAAPLTLAVRGAGPFKEPIPLRMITVLPNADGYSMAVAARTGLTSLDDVREQRYPLKVSVRGQRDHCNHFFQREILAAYGFSYDDLIAWGGQIHYDPGLPSGTATSGPNVDVTRFDLVDRGERDAIFDEAVNSWIPRALERGMRVLSIKEPIMQQLETMGFRRAVLTPERYPGLPETMLGLDFSGWGVYTHADVPDAVVTGFCAAMEACKDRIHIYGDAGPVPLDVGCKDTPGGPLDIPLHPAAERFWRERGYLP
jgi:TRAP-type uncharacterized transport system substrate-binding protein